MEPGWLDDERVEKTRSAYAHARCNLMEAALRTVGYHPRSQHWAIAVMVAKISVGWEPLVRDIQWIANDCDFRKATKSKSEANRRKMARRVLNDLHRWGLFVVTSTDGVQPRKTRPIAVLTIACDPKMLRDIINGTAEPIENGTFAEHLRNTEGTFAEHLRNTKGTFTEHLTDNQPSSLYCIPLPQKLPKNPNPTTTLGGRARLTASPLATSDEEVVVVDRDGFLEEDSHGDDTVDPSWTDAETKRLSSVLQLEKLSQWRNAVKTAKALHWSTTDFEAVIDDWREDGLPIGALGNRLLRPEEHVEKLLRKRRNAQLGAAEIRGTFISGSANSSRFVEQDANRLRSKFFHEASERGYSRWTALANIGNNFAGDRFSGCVNNDEWTAQRIYKRVEEIGKQHSATEWIRAELKRLVRDLGDMPIADVESELDEIEQRIAKGHADEISGSPTR